MTIPLGIERQDQPYNSNPNRNSNLISRPQTPTKTLTPIPNLTKLQP